MLGLRFRASLAVRRKINAKSMLGLRFRASLAARRKTDAKSIRLRPFRSTTDTDVAAWPRLSVCTG
jgi:hypothetical protein